jgi:hypothetical protein
MTEPICLVGYLVVYLYCQNLGAALDHLCKKFLAHLCHAWMIVYNLELAVLELEADYN